MRKAVAELLERLLGKFVKGINENSLRLNALEGDLTLENLALRHEAFEALNLPLAIADGQLAAIRVKVPWRNLHEERVIIEMHDVVLILTPKDISNAATAKEEELAIAAKRAALEAQKQGKGGGAALQFRRRAGREARAVAASAARGGGSERMCEFSMVMACRRHGDTQRACGRPAAPPVGGSRLGKQTFEAMLAAIVRKSVKVDGVAYLTPPVEWKTTIEKMCLPRTRSRDRACDFVLASAALSLAIEYDPASARGVAATTAVHTVIGRS